MTADSQREMIRIDLMKVKGPLAGNKTVDSFAPRRRCRDDHSVRHPFRADRGQSRRQASLSARSGSWLRLSRQRSKAEHILAISQADLASIAEASTSMGRFTSGGHAPRCEFRPSRFFFVERARSARGEMVSSDDGRIWRRLVDNTADAVDSRTLSGPNQSAGAKERGGRMEIRDSRRSRHNSGPLTAAFPKLHSSNGGPARHRRHRLD